MGNSIIGFGVYTLCEASLYGGISSSKLSRWVWGTNLYKSVIKPELRDERLVSFHDLVQAKAIQVARDEGIPLRKIRQAVETAQEKYNVNLPLARNHKLLWFEGDLHIQLNGVYQVSGKGRHQIGMKEIIEPFAKDLHFDKDGLACMWTPFENKGIKISLNPKVQFGQPIVGNTGYRADVLNKAYLAENSYKSVVDEFAVEVEDVKTAVLYMNSLKDAA